MTTQNPWLVAGGWLSAIAAVIHLACIFGGPDWYRFLGAGEGMAQAAERGEWWAAAITMGIAIVLAIWAAYAFSGAGMIGRLPLLRTGLVVISVIYLLRGLAFVPIAFSPAAQTPFNIWSSAIVLGYGVAYAVGTWLAWSSLSNKAVG